MPTIINPYKSGSGMGEDLFGLGGIADAFFGPKASQSALLREKFKEAQRQNEYTPRLAESARLLGTPTGNLGDTIANAIMSGANIDEVTKANLALVAAANKTNLAGDDVAAAGVGAKVPFASLPQGFNAQLQKSYDIAQMQVDKANELQRWKDSRELIPVVDLTKPGGVGTRTRAEVIANPGMYTQAPTPEQVKGTMAANLLFPTPGAAPAAPAVAPGPSVLSPDDSIAPATIATTPITATGVTAPTRTPVVMTAEQRHFLGADPQKPEGDNFIIRRDGNIIHSGVTTNKGATERRGDQEVPIVLGPKDTIQIVNPLNPTSLDQLGTAPGKSEQQKRRESVDQANQALDSAGRILNIVNKNPTAVGAVGNLRRMGQEGIDLLNSLNTQFGAGREGDYERAVATTRNDLVRKFGPGARALIPEMFDDDLNSIQTLNGMLVYQAAGVLGQKGRDASDKDIAYVRNIVGSPDSWFQGPGTYRSKLGALMREIQTQRDGDLELLKPNAKIGPSATVAPPSTGASTRAAPAAPAANPAIDDLVRKYLPGTGGP